MENKDIFAGATEDSEEVKAPVAEPTELTDELTPPAPEQLATPTPEQIVPPVPEQVAPPVFPEQPPVQQPYTQQAPQQPYVQQPPRPSGRFIYYPDGTRTFVPDQPQPQQQPYNPQYYNQQPGNQQPYNQNIPTPPKKGGAGRIVLAVILSIVLVACVGIFAAVVVPKLVNPDEDGSGSGSDDTSSRHIITVPDDSEDVSVYDETSVPDIITVTPPNNEAFDDLVAVYEECADSCVTILCTVKVNMGYYEQTGQSLGSGFIVEGKKNGEKGYYIVTNHHVIEDATEIKVKYNDGEIYTATLLGSDELSDIAVLQTERIDVKPIEMGDSNALKVGQTVVAIGTPSAEELQNTMSYGIVSGLNRELQMQNDYGTVVKTMTVIQTTATLNPGNSGGPLINMEGQVVGINAMKLMQDYEGIGFALPSTEASYIINCLIEYGKVMDYGDGFVSGTAQLGISGYTVTDEVRDQLSLGDDCPDGVVVINVNRGTSVYEAGLSIYDVITEYNGTKITDIEQLKELLGKSKAGSEVSLTFYRIGRRGEESQYHTIKFKLDTAK